MKLTTLKLTAFRSFTNTTVHLDAPRVLVVGLNGVGKSSIRESLKWIFSGKCAGLDGKGSGVECLVPTLIENQGRLVEATMSVEGIGAITRIWTPAGTQFTVDKFTGNAQAQQAGLLNVLKTTEPFLQACLDSSVFLALNHIEAKALVLNLLNVRVPVDGKQLTLDELEAAYQKAYNDRRTQKALQKTTQVSPKPEGEYPAVEAIEARLKVLRDELEGVSKTVGKTLGARQTLTALHDQLEKAGPAYVKVPPEFDGLPEADIPDLIHEAEERLGLMDVPSQSVAGQPETISVLKSREEALARHEPKKGCVLDPSVPCETPKAKFGKQAMVIRKQIEQTPQESLQHIEQGPKHALLTRIDALKTLQRSFQTTKDLNFKRRQDLERVTQQLSELPDVSTQEGTVADLKQRIQKGDGVLKAARAHATACSEHERTSQAAKGLAETIAALEASCDLLGPSGARVPALEAAIGSFEAAINGSLEPFGWVIHFQVDPEWAVFVNERPVQTFSRSEQYRIGVAVQLAIAKLSGLSFAVVDELDMLDDTSRKLFGQILYESDLEQILILGTRESSVPLPPGSVRMIAVRLKKDGDWSVVAEKTTTPEAVVA